MLDFLLTSLNQTSGINFLLEFLCFILGILSVWYARKENILVYPTGLISTGITVYLLYLTNDVGNMLVNAYFSVMSIYGWYNWKYSKSDGNESLKISRTSTKQKVLGIVIGIFTFILVYIIYMLFNIKITILTFIDLLTTAIFFVAMWYMALKKVESWVLWTLGNVMIVPLFVSRDLKLLSLQYIILTFLAISSYLRWRKMSKI